MGGRASFCQEEMKRITRNNIQGIKKNHLTLLFEDL